jgi:outer membrane lipoprotein-sorting protein
MGDLEEVLELLHGGGSSFRTLRATIVTRRVHDLVSEAHRRSVEEAERRGMKTLSVSVGFADPNAPRESTERTRIWFEPPDRIRAETEGRRSSTVVMDGKHSFRTAALGDEIVRGPLRSPYEIVPPLFLLRPEALLASYLFEPLGQTEVARRTAIDVRARLRPGEAVVRSSRLSWGADEHRLAVDRERGVLLRVAAIMDGQEFDVTGMTEVAFDEPIEADVFRFEPPPGVETITAEDHARRLRASYARPRRSGLETMARQAQFVVFEPPNDGHPVVSQSGSFRADGVSVSYTQFWGDEEHAFELVQWAQADDAAGPQTVSEAADGSLVARAVRDGTAIEVSSRTLGRERLLEVLATLEPIEP